MSKKAAGKQGKKGTGHRPAHENSFAFIHNANSRKTKKILEMPNEGLCRRCHDKIEWRKKYRKYKPLKVPGVCNFCKGKTVKAAYHKACRPCASEKKVCPSCLKSWKDLGGSGGGQPEEGDGGGDESENDDEEDDEPASDGKQAGGDNKVAGKSSSASTTDAAPIQQIEAGAVKGVVSSLVSRYQSSLEALEVAHLDWTLDVSIAGADEEGSGGGEGGLREPPPVPSAAVDDEPGPPRPPAPPLQPQQPPQQPAILSPFLPSRPGAITALLTRVLPDLGPNDVILDVGCGDGRVLVAAAQLTGCRGIGIDVSPHCISSARDMVRAEDTATSASTAASPASNAAPLLSECLTFYEADCVADPGAITRFARGEGDDGGPQATVLYLYVYPTLLERIRQEVEVLSRRRRPWPYQNMPVCRVVTVGYHFDGWPAAASTTVSPGDDETADGDGGKGAGAAGREGDGGASTEQPYEIRLLKPAA